MDYLFFDIECANCDNGMGKICSFGYVLCDNEFNILEKKDILINPNAKFSHGVLSKKYITLGYPKSEFLSQPKFNEMYTVIRDILTRQNQLVIGHAVDNDVNFILGECDRYKLPVFEYDFYDSQELYRLHTQSNLHKNLSAICEELGVEKGNAHRSDDDAEMAMLVAKTLCERLNQTLPELLDRYPSCKHNIDDLIIKHKKRKQYHLFKQFLVLCKKEKTFPANSLSGKKICFSRKIEALDYAKTAKLILFALNSGAKYESDVEKCDILIRGKGGCDRLTKALKNSKINIISLTAFCKILNVNYAAIIPLNLSKYVGRNQINKL